ncbi:MAG: hypothetical protein P8075_13400 [Deltaproteobacteria bacterium]|jgi:hypothetical protein
MKRIGVLATTICLLFLSGCYVSTNVKVQNRQLPADFSAPVLVVTVQDKTGLESDQLNQLEQNALQALNDKGINSVSLQEAVGDADPDKAIRLLLDRDYSALLKIVIDFWGSKTAVLPDPVLTSVDRSDTGPGSGSSFRPPSSLDYEESMPSTRSSYKEVDITAYLTDLQSSQLAWSARVSARPAVVGRSWLYHSFNSSLKYDKLADRCLKKIAGELGSIWPQQ